MKVYTLSDMKKKKVYVGLAADILHEGHINILKIASKLGKVTVGLLTDAAIASYKKFPHLNFYQRETVLKNIRYVDNVVKQNSLDYTDNLIKLKPDIVVHGDDWKIGIQKNVRSKVIKVLKKWSGKLVEPKYTKNISSSLIKEKIRTAGTTADIRRAKLRRLIEAKDIVRVIEVHSPIVGLIAEKANFQKKNLYKEFDAMWSSSLTDSMLRGKPDNQSVDYSTRIYGLNEIMEVTTKPLIFDGDNGGRIEHIGYMVKNLERIGVSALIIEDKKGLKKNSLFQNQKGALQDSIGQFSKKKKKEKSSQVSEEFMIIARIESLILNKGMSDALKRAEAYSKAGADAIVIHSKKNNPDEIFEFSKKFKKNKFFKPLVSIPSTYSKTKESQLKKNNFKIVIYANQMMRSSYPKMLETANSILKFGRAKEVEKNIMSVNEIIALIQ